MQKGIQVRLLQETRKLQNRSKKTIHLVYFSSRNESAMLYGHGPGWGGGPPDFPLPLCACILLGSYTRDIMALYQLKTERRSLFSSITVFTVKTTGVWCTHAHTHTYSYAVKQFPILPFQRTTGCAHSGLYLAHVFQDGFHPRGPSSPSTPT